MAEQNGSPSVPALAPRPEPTPVVWFMHTLTDRRLLIATSVVAALAFAAIYLSLTPRVYEARADMLVSPVARDDASLVGLGLITESSDPTRDVSTAALLIRNADVAARVDRQLALPGPSEGVLRDVSVEPVAQSTIVAITASASSPQKARELANAVGRAAVQVRTEKLAAEVDDAITRLRQRIQDTPPEASTQTAFAQQLVALEALQGGPDPTLRLETPAALPTGPVSPRPKLAVLAALFAGLLIGVAGAVAMSAIDPRVWREEDVRAAFQLPVLARLPRPPGGRRGSRSKPFDLTAEDREAYRRLCSLLDSYSIPREGGLAMTVMVTSATSSEGRTPTALNIASAFAGAGRRVILIETDLRNPSLAAAFGVQVTHGTAAVLEGSRSLAESLMPAPNFRGRLELLVADGHTVRDTLGFPSVDSLLGQARALADVVIIDAPPPSAVADALAFAGVVDHVVLAVWLQRTRMAALTQLVEALDENGITPTGLAILGAHPARSRRRGADLGPTPSMPRRERSQGSRGTTVASS